DGAAQPEATGVVEGLDGGDLAQLFDDSGEHFPGPPACGARTPGLLTRAESTSGNTGSDAGRSSPRRRTGTAARMDARPPRTASHPDFNRRSRNFTWSTGRWRRPGRGL